MTSCYSVMENIFNFLLRFMMGIGSLLDLCTENENELVLIADTE